MDRPKRVAIYARVSSAAQAKRDLSIPEQIRQIEDFCDRRGWSVVATFKDPGKTGSETANRPQFQRMVEAACSAAHPFDLILVWDQSRFGRSHLDSAIRAQLRDHDVAVDNISSPSGDMDATLTPAGELVEAIQGAVDIHTRKMSTVQMIRGQKAKARKGGLPGAQATCYGYKQEWEGLNGGRPARKPVVDKAEAKIICEMFRRYITGDSLLGITRWLNESGVSAPRGKKWYESTVRKLLSNETLLGRLVYGRIKKVKHPLTRTPVNRLNDGEVIRVDNAFPAIIDRESFDRVQAILSRNESTRPQGGHPGNTLRGIGKCHNCSWHLAHQRHTGSGRWYYMCGREKSNGASDPACKGIVYADYVDEVVAAFLEGMLRTGISVLRKQIRQYNATAKDLTGLGPLESYDLAIAEQQAKIENLVAAVAKGTKSPSIFKTLEEAEAKVAELQAKRTTIAVAVHVPAVDVDNILSAREDIAASLKRSDGKRIRAILDAIVAEVRCDWRRRKNPVVSFTYRYESKPMPTGDTQEDREEREFRIKSREEFTPKDAPLVFIPRWSIITAERAAEDALRQISEALA
ncbi:MAG TPA: recombinase family protein [Candidatus Cybelea sp.]|jgi:DNA invertase Pin-like site-specific DNA recombinase